MLTYVLDASAYLRLALQEPGEMRIAEIIEDHTQRRARIIISAVQWGEIVKIITTRKGQETVAKIARYFQLLGIELVAATAERAERAALIGLKYEISYADAFGVELAFDTPDHILVTADYGVRPAEIDIKIEFLPTKPKQ